MSKSVNVTSPLHITTFKKDRAVKTALNFNRLTSMHGFQYSALKEHYTNIMLDKVKDFPVFNKIEITYTIYVARMSDLMNWVSVIDKFFQDVLVKAGKLKDDNIEYVPVIHSVFGGMDRKNPRAEITIKEYESK